jgi:hypothetical protein
MTVGQLQNCKVFGTCMFHVFCLSLKDIRDKMAFIN